MAITLYDLAGAEDERRFSPNCWRITLALLHKGLAFTTVPWRFTDKAAIAFSGQGAVPVLVDDGQVVHDSLPIALHLDAHYPARPLYDGEQARALTACFNQWVLRAVHPPILKAILPDLFSHLHERDRSYFRTSREQRFGMTLEAFAADGDQAVAQLSEALAPVRTVLAAQPFVCGTAPGFADYVLYGPFQWARAVSPVALLAHDDPVFAWRERVLDLYGGYARNALGYPIAA